MKKIVSIAIAGAMAAASVLPVTPAMAGSNDRDGRDWCKFGKCDRGGDRYSGRDRDRDWDRGWDRHSRWDRDRDRRWRHRDRGFDGADAAGLVFGLAAGAIAGSAIAGAGGGSYERCASAYRSFDPATWTYLGYDGYRHRCPY